MSKKRWRKIPSTRSLLQKCQNCRVSVFKVLDEEEDLTNDAPLIKWRKFEYVVTGVYEDNSDEKKLKLVDKLTSPGEMFLCLKKLLEIYPSHQFRANWQNQQLQDLIDNLPVGHAVAVHDYSKTTAVLCKIQIQSLYFSQVQASIHIYHSPPPCSDQCRRNPVHSARKLMNVMMK